MHDLKKSSGGIIMLAFCTIICISFGFWLNSPLLASASISIFLLSASVFIYIRMLGSKKQNHLQQQLARDALEYAKLERQGEHIPLVRTKA